MVQELWLEFLFPIATRISWVVNITQFKELPLGVSFSSDIIAFTDSDLKMGRKLQVLSLNLVAYFELMCSHFW